MSKREKLNFDKNLVLVCRISTTASVKFVSMGFIVTDLNKDRIIIDRSNITTIADRLKREFWVEVRSLRRYRLPEGMRGIALRVRSGGVSLYFRDFLLYLKKL
jgi:hypothetical protein